MKCPAQHAPLVWRARQCPFRIEYDARVLDDIRLAATDALRSVPDRGAEILGILLGNYEKGRLAIVDHLPLPFDHRADPTFSLAAKDHLKLADLLATARNNPRRGHPVGWYVSRAQGGISLSDADVEIHQRYFPEPWHVVLVVQPHASDPARAGFFFRNRRGAMRTSESYQEFAIQAVTARTAAAVDALELRDTTMPAEPVRRRRRRFYRVAVPVLALLACASGAAGAYAGRTWWLPLLEKSKTRNRNGEEPNRVARPRIEEREPGSLAN